MAGKVGIDVAMVGEGAGTGVKEMPTDGGTGAPGGRRKYKRCELGSVVELLRPRGILDCSCDRGGVVLFNVMPSCALFLPFHCTLHWPARTSLATVDSCSSSHSINNTFVASATLVLSASYSNRASADATPAVLPSAESGETA